VNLVPSLCTLWLKSNLITIQMKKIILIFILLIGLTIQAQNGKFKTYRVSAHETITSIAKKIGITPYDLLKLNPDAEDGIHIDEVLIIPNKVFKNTTQVLPVKTKDSIVDGYIYHTVKPLETVYSLATKYKISKRKVRKLNKLNKKGDISVGQVLKFPTKLNNTNSEVVSAKTETSTPLNTFLYTVQPKDTFYTLNRLYHVSEDELKKLNPILNEGLKAGLSIYIPKPQEEGVTTVTPITPETPTTIDTVAVVSQPNYKIHKVQAKEGFFRLKQIYGVSKEELLAINPQIKDGLKLGMEIKIPIKKEENLFVETDVHGKQLNVVMMLPFKANVETPLDEKSKKSVRLHKVTDFYLGSLMALDSLKKKGLSVHVKVFDTKNSDFVVNNILSTYNFDQTDLVIAPIKFKHFKAVSRQLESKDVPVISPVSSKDCSVLGLKNTIQNTPSKTVKEEAVLNYILSNLSNQNVIIIADEKKPTEKELFNIDLIKSKLLKHDSIKKVTVLRMKDGYIERELFEESLKDKQENWVVLASNKEATTYMAVENLAVFPESYKVTLFSLLKPKKLTLLENSYRTSEEEQNKDTYFLKSEYLNKLNFQFPSVNFKEDTNKGVANFKNTYLQKFGSSPTSLSYKGFDTMYDALIRIASTPDKMDAFQTGVSNRLHSQFKYRQNQNESFTNYGVFLLRYHDFKLEKVY